MGLRIAPFKPSDPSVMTLASWKTPCLRAWGFITSAPRIPTVGTRDGGNPIDRWSRIYSDVDPVAA
jgi:hypothetical protein